MFRQLPFDKTVPYRRNMRQISSAKLRGIRVTKRDSIESQQNIPSQCVSRPVFQFQLSDAASSPEFFLYFLLFSLSLFLSLYLLSLWDGESEVWNSNTGKVSPRITLSRLYRGPSSMVEILGILSWHGLLLFIGYASDWIFRQ